MEQPNRNRILIVEDDKHIRRFIAINLGRAGYATTEAATGEEALRSFRESAPDVALLDIMLPDTDGLELCAKFRNIEPDVVIVFLTALGQDTDKIKGLELGADDYIVKPFNPLELVARIRNILRRTSQTAAPPKKVLANGAIRLDLASTKLFKHDRCIELTPKEFQMLRTFMTYPDRALSRDELLNLIWGEDYVGDTKTVDVHVRKLREKIEDDASRPKRIETVWGVGYLWRGEE
ncbi:response regulator transcription factor [Cohnella nanjingensis]|uniref:Response regulator transcription factor n=1 Tax=Cohnella nanjingensis TaxID=1387779 RepID=A0A7X0VE80_9BACL|nr:response regulator transcription factor [Cohnella nanjingensis]MBB6670720.1 response regulator transcription factor [Cohnella nanjingensis]